MKLVRLALAVAVLLALSAPASAVTMQLAMEHYKLLGGSGEPAYYSQLTLNVGYWGIPGTTSRLTGFAIHTPAMAADEYQPMTLVSGGGTTGLSGQTRKLTYGPGDVSVLDSVAGTYRLKIDILINGTAPWTTITEFTLSAVDDSMFVSPATILNPVDGQEFVLPQPTLRWLAPADIERATRMVVQTLVDPEAGGEGFAAVASATHIGNVDIPWDANSWCPGVLPRGTGSFAVNYSLTIPAAEAATTPTIISPASVPGLLQQTWAVADPQCVTTTYANFTVLPGDFNGDGKVNGGDFLIWQSHFPTFSGATVEMGDGNGDGKVNGADFLIWQANYRPL